MDNAKADPASGRATRRIKNEARLDPEVVAIQGLGFIAADDDLLRRFLNETGCDPGDLRERARDPGFLGGVLDFLLAWEPRLLAFANASGIVPESVEVARRKLPGAAVE